LEKVTTDHIFSTKIEDFKRFKFFLRENDILKGRKTLRRADLEKADRLDTVDLMVQTYKRDEALEMTKDILRRINRNDLVEICSSAAEGQSQEAKY
uniref:Pyrin domain-containing protein n=1 Tax=Seriola dumerili TaxID=41447 RepID=A0A3B4T2J3_SERDU